MVLLMAWVYFGLPRAQNLGVRIHNLSLYSLVRPHAHTHIYGAAIWPRSAPFSQNVHAARLFLSRSTLTPFQSAPTSRRCLQIKTLLCVKGALFFLPLIAGLLIKFQSSAHTRARWTLQLNLQMRTNREWGRQTLWQASIKSERCGRAISGNDEALLMAAIASGLKGFVCSA